MAGGASRRFGSDKARHSYLGLMLIERALSALETADEVFSVGATPPPGSRATEIHDIHSGHGPIGGIHSALVHASNAWVAVVACDMPFLDGRLWPYLMRRSTETLLVVPEGPEGLEPLAAMYHRDLIPLLESRMHEGKLSLYTLCEAVSHAIVPWPELRLAFGESVFLNANRPEDLP